MENNKNKETSFIREQIAVICGFLGHLYKDEYLIEPNCEDGIKDLIRLLKKDNMKHLNRLCMGEISIVQNHLCHIIKMCRPDDSNLFNLSLRFLINITTPAMVLYGEEIPQDKYNRHIFLSLITHHQKHKLAFSDCELWCKICCRLTNLFEKKWIDRSADDGIEIERILTLLRNILHIPADVEEQKKPDFLTVHNKVLYALRESQILELLLLIASKKDEESYYLNLLEIFSLLLREQNSTVLAQYEIDELSEKNQDTEDLLKARKTEKKFQKNHLNTRNFISTFVVKGIKSASNMDIICHKSLENIKSLNFSEKGNQMRSRKKVIPIDNHCSTTMTSPSVRLFLKEFCMEFLTSNFGYFMNTVKSRIDSGKSLAYDQTYYFWAITFFFKFAIKANLNFDFLKDCFSVELFHFLQTNIELAFEHFDAGKKNCLNWVKRIHIILKAYQSLLETLLWMDCSKKVLVRAMSREIKSNLFYVVEYRELTLYLLLKYDSLKFSISYLRDLIETSHLFLKLLEEFSKHSKLLIQKVVREKQLKKKINDNCDRLEKKNDENWNNIKNSIQDCLASCDSIPEIIPFDFTLSIPVEEETITAMRQIQKFLHEGSYKQAIGLLRSARKLWPENDYFGSEDIDLENELSALKEIFSADLGPIKENKKSKGQANTLEKESILEDEDQELQNAENQSGNLKIIEKEFDIMDYKKRLVNRKIVENCGILLRNYKKNSDHVNHCVIKLLYRIGWECCMPAMLYQASLFCTLLMIMNDKNERFDEINTFTKNLFQKFRKHASKNPIIFIELLFWKTRNVALEIQHGYEAYKASNQGKKGKANRKKNSAGKKNKNTYDESFDLIKNNCDEEDAENFNDSEEGLPGTNNKKTSKNLNKEFTEDLSLRSSLKEKLEVNQISDSEISESEMQNSSPESEKSNDFLENSKYLEKVYSNGNFNDGVKVDSDEEKKSNPHDEEFDPRYLVAGVSAEKRNKNTKNKAKTLGIKIKSTQDNENDIIKNKQIKLKRSRFIRSNFETEEDLENDDDDDFLKKIKRQKRIKSNIIDSDSSD